MARLPIQETAEYYNWLFRIETQEFEKELLEIVSSNQLPILHHFKMSNLSPKEYWKTPLIHDYNYRASDAFYTCQMKQYRSLPIVRSGY